MGLAGVEQLARPRAECGPDELWRGELTAVIERHRFLELQLKWIESKLDALAKSGAAVQLLTTVPGIGARTAEVIATHLGDATRFKNADGAGAHAGPVPRQYRSGLTDRRGRIPKRGSKLLRGAPVECARCSLRYSAWAREVTARLQSNGVSEKKAIVALAREPSVRCWGMLRKGVAWVEPVPAAAPPAAGVGVRRGGATVGGRGATGSFRDTA